MILDQKLTIPAPPEKVWDFMVDIPAVSRCVPGAGPVEQVDGNQYKGTISQRVGPIKVLLDGTLALVEQNREEWRAVMNAQGVDPRASSRVNAKMTLTLRPLEDDQTELNIHTDASLFGKLGEFGQAVAQKKANQVMSEFGKNMTRELTQEGAAAEEGPAPEEKAAPVGATVGARARPEPGPGEEAAREPGPFGLAIIDRESALKWAVPTLAGLGGLLLVIWMLARRDGGSQKGTGAHEAYRTGRVGRPSVEFSVRADWA